jgi:hypothetical protein
VRIFFQARRSFAMRLRTAGYSIVFALGVALVTRAQEAVAPPNQYGGAASVRSGGVIEDSYYYHHLGPMRSAIEAGGIPQANGWYEYGFPMQSYRWGWFGAALSARDLARRVLWGLHSDGLSRVLSGEAAWRAKLAGYWWKRCSIISDMLNAVGRC